MRNNAESLLQNRIPALLEFYQKMNWQLPESIDRVYVIDKAKKYLGYAPKYNIEQLLREEFTII